MGGGQLRQLCGTRASANHLKRLQFWQPRFKYLRDLPVSKRSCFCLGGRCLFRLSLRCLFRFSLFRGSFAGCFESIEMLHVLFFGGRDETPF